ncbi:serine arginine repetitive matrix 1 [Micractinium conductrix]|uniref:Serine arginine repetitive matrix 1 n=1 Tax=Micractinium conductrix TaxID=554055 RepID=A0A2P6VDH1_9CHLO|nr:serine arginine repetitive matrix 1 [Micractinium conductrix]|eukprot:PSC72111.1 serine arginine repetitive matrix 1 [Micractinium conductrix]
MSGNAFRGVSAEQDSRFANKEKKLMKSMKFPPEFSTKVDLTAVNWDTMKPWIAKRITELLGGLEDDVLIAYVIEQLEGKKNVDPRQLQISLTGFLEKNTSLFCKELWQLLISANETGTGIPQRFLDEKAEEMRRAKEEAERLQEAIREARRQQEERERAAAEARARAEEEAREAQKRQREEMEKAMEEARARDRERGGGRDDSRERRRRGSRSPRRRRSSRSRSRDRRHRHSSRDRRRRSTRERRRRSRSGSRDQRRRRSSREREDRRRNRSGSREAKDRDAKEESPGRRPARSGSLAAIDGSEERRRRRSSSPEAKQASEERREQSPAKPADDAAAEGGEEERKPDGSPPAEGKGARSGSSSSSSSSSSDDSVSDDDEGKARVEKEARWKALESLRNSRQAKAPHRARPIATCKTLKNQIRQGTHVRWLLQSSGGCTRIILPSSAEGRALAWRRYADMRVEVASVEAKNMRANFAAFHAAATQSAQKARRLLGAAAAGADVAGAEEEEAAAPAGAAEPPTQATTGDKGSRSGEGRAAAAAERHELLANVDACVARFADLAARAAALEPRCQELADDALRRAGAALATYLQQQLGWPAKPAAATHPASKAAGPAQGSTENSPCHLQATPPPPRQPPRVVQPRWRN